MKKKVAILGAGIAGLSAGWLLKQRGIDFKIFEKQSYVGGLARSFVWNGLQPMKMSCMNCLSLFRWAGMLDAVISA